MLIVEHSIMYRKIWGKAVESTGVAAVENFASSEITALERLMQAKVDVVLLDAAMPEIDIIGLVKKIKKDFPQSEIIMIGDHERDNVSNTSTASIILEAHSNGVLDFIAKLPGSDLDKVMEHMKIRLCALFTQIVVKRYSNSTLQMASQIKQEEHILCKSRNNPGLGDSTKFRTNFKEPDIVVIASSTGGPAAIETVCSTLPQSFEKPILIVQHMPAEFTRVLSNSLNGKCPLKVIEGKDGLPVKPGHIIIAPGGFHMTVMLDNSSGKVISLKDTPHVNGVKPSADVLFSSIAEVYEGRGVAVVVLTGMGNDGLKGVMEIKRKCKCYCITQTEKTCVVYGMPRSIFEAGLSDEVLDLEKISRRLQQVASGRS